MLAAVALQLVLSFVFKQFYLAKLKLVHLIALSIYILSSDCGAVRARTGPGKGVTVSVLVCLTDTCH